MSIKNFTHHRGPQCLVNHPPNYTFSGRAAAGAFGGRDGGVPVREGPSSFDAHSKLNYLIYRLTVIRNQRVAF